MKRLLTGMFMVSALAANAALWEGVTDENYICGPKIAERDLLGKAVLVFRYSGGEQDDARAPRFEDLYKSHDKKRFIVIGTVPGKSKTAADGIAKLKLSFPCYKDVRLTTDPEKRREYGGTMMLVNQYGKIVVGGLMNRDTEEFIVNAITEVGLPPNVAPGVTLEKYKALKNKLKLGVNLKGVIKALEKDVAAGEKKTANAQVKAKAAEASSILSAIRDGKSEIYDNATALADINPEAAYLLLSQYLKSFPEEMADNKDRLAELKAKAAEAKKAAK